jgi:asparagine N-glycosylation enzyme membrane subunit Stt3
MTQRRIASLSPIAVFGLAFAWPSTIVVGGTAYVLAPALRAWSAESLAAIGFHIRVTPLSETWPGLVLLFLPPLALLSTWIYLRRKERDAQRGASIE